MFKHPVKAMDDELNESDEYLNNITDVAATIATRLTDNFSRDHLEMFEKLILSMESRNCNQEAIYVAQVILDHHSKNGKAAVMNSNDFDF